MVEEVDKNNLYISVSSPNLNFNITRNLEIGPQVNAQERFYSISMGVEVQVTYKTLWMCLEIVSSESHRMTLFLENRVSELLIVIPESFLWFVSSFLSTKLT